MGRHQGERKKKNEGGSNVSQIKYNTKSKIHQVKEKIIKLLEAVHIPLRNNQYFLIPLNGKVPVRGFQLSKLYDGEFIEEDFTEGITGYGLATGLHWLVVLDFDDEGAFERFKNEFKAWADTLIVKTRRGYHVYFVIKDKDVRNEPGKRIGKIDVKTGRSYVVLPFSVVEEFQYTVFQYRAVKRISYVEYKSLLDLIESEFKEEKETEEVEEELEELELEEEENASLAERIAEKLLPYYQKGQRQSLCLAIAGYLLKKNVSYEVAEQVIKTLHAKSNDEERLSKRLSALQQSFKKPREILAGASLLKELISEETLRELDELTSKFVVFVGSSVFVQNEKEQVWEEIQYKSKKAVRTQVCSLFSLLKVYSEPELRYVIHSTLTDEIVELSNDVREFKNVLHVFSSNKLELLLFALTKRAKIVKRKDVLGWDKNKKIFYHPALIHDFEFIIPKPFSEEDFHVDEETKRKHHEIIYQALQEGSLLGVKYVLALASIFASFTVVDVAPRGTGKTLTSWLACQLFCRYRKPLTLFATETALELLFSKFKNFPVLLDEAALSTDEKTQKLVFLLKSQVGKLRGTKHLKVQARDIEGVAFLTSERDFDFDRLGAERRIIKLQASNFKDYTTLFTTEQLVNCLPLYGAGIDYVAFYLENRQEIDQTESTFKAKIMSDIPVAISKAFKLLQSYYKDDFESLKSKITEVLREQEEQAERDTFEIFIDKFKQFVVMNKHYFSKDAKNLYYGEIIEETDKWKVYVLTSIFDEFCKKENFSKDYVLKKAKERKILETKDYNRFVQVKKLLGKAVSVYVFVFEEQDEEEQAKIPF